MDNLPLASKMVLYHIRDTTLSAGPVRHRPRYNMGLPISITTTVVALLYLVGRALS